MVYIIVEVDNAEDVGKNEKRRWICSDTKIGNVIYGLGEGSSVFKSFVNEVHPATTEE